MNKDKIVLSGAELQHAKDALDSIAAYNSYERKLQAETQEKLAQAQKVCEENCHKAFRAIVDGLGMDFEAVKETWALEARHADVGIALLVDLRAGDQVFTSGQAAS